MDEVERLIDAYSADVTHSVVAWKLGVVMDLERLPDPRVVPFLLQILGDPHEPTEVRLDVLKRVRNGRLTAEERPRVAQVMMRVLRGLDTVLCVQSALALGEFTDLPGVVNALSALVLPNVESFDLRYAAFTSIGRAGPTREALDALSQLTDDELLGRSTASILHSWRIV